jgi:transcriptional regulator with XRE-family HTH domain
MRRLREERGVSRRELADLWGCGVANVGLVETGKRPPTLRQVALFASRFSISMDTLMAGAPLADDRKAG